MNYNHKDDIKRIEGFVGKECQRTLACNSIKLRFGEKRPYIWIDPPWIFFKDKNFITASYEYPETDEDFDHWSKTLNPINKALFESFTFSNGVLTLNFDNGYLLEIPQTTEEADEEDFYHHWYAST